MCIPESSCKGKYNAHGYLTYQGGEGLSNQFEKGQGTTTCCFIKKYGWNMFFWLDFPSISSSLGIEEFWHVIIAFLSDFNTECPDSELERVFINVHSSIVHAKSLTKIILKKGYQGQEWQSINNALADCHSFRQYSAGNQVTYAKVGQHITTTKQGEHTNLPVLCHPYYPSHQHLIRAAGMKPWETW